MKNIFPLICIIALLSACVSAPAPARLVVLPEKKAVPPKPVGEVPPVTEKISPAIETTPPVQPPPETTRPVNLVEEYFICRAFAAQVLDKYPPVKNEVLNRYVNLTGLALTLHSDRPYTYGGYHFAVIQSGDINAFSCSAGTTLLSKGLIDIIESEDELAAILAHEIAHITYRDSIAHILLPEIRPEGEEDTIRARDLLDKASTGVYDTVLGTGYGRSVELSADRKAVEILLSTGYDPNALTDILRKINNRNKSKDNRAGYTHPSLDERIHSLEQASPYALSDNLSRAKRDQRFKALIH